MSRLQEWTNTIRGLVPNRKLRISKSGSNTTITEHFRVVHNRRLQYPDILGVCLSGAKAPFPVIIPIELCTILPGQLYKKKIPTKTFP
jgi:eukaryotic translation initiation factor 2C